MALILFYLNHQNDINIQKNEMNNEKEKNNFYMIGLD